MLRLDLMTAYRWPIRKQMPIFVLTVLLTVCLGYFFDISSSLFRLRKASHLEADMKAQLIATMKTVSKGEVEISAMPILEKHLAAWKSRLIPATEVSNVLDDILRAGTNNSLYFGLFDPGESETSASQSDIPLRIVALGNYHAIASFLSRIAAFPPLIKIERLSLETEVRSDVVGQKLVTLHSFLAPSV